MKIGEWKALSNKNIPIQVSLNAMNPMIITGMSSRKQLPHVVTGQLDLRHKSEAQIGPWCRAVVLAVVSVSDSEEE